MAFTDVEMAILSQLAYKDLKKHEGKSLHSVLTDKKIKSYLEKELGSGYDKQLSALISKVKDSDYTIAKAQNNTKAGFAAFAVKDPDNNITVACRGTEMGKLFSDPNATVTDLAEDVCLALDNQTKQQADMAKFMKSLQTGDYKSYSFTGHSLGGNLAMYGAITLKDSKKLSQCKTFNAPGFSSHFYRDNEKAIAKAEKKITSYQNKYDGVSEALKVPGKKVILSSKKKKRNGVTGHLLKDLVLDGNKFKKAKKQKKSNTALGSVLYVLSRLPDSILILGPVPVTMPISFRAGVKLGNAAAAVSSGSQKIQLEPEELKNMAAQMVALSDEYTALFDGVVAELNCANKNWSVNLANNFSGKIASAQGKFKDIPDLLASGAAVANLAAINYEGIDTLMATIIRADSYGQDSEAAAATVGEPESI